MLFRSDDALKAFDKSISLGGVKLGGKDQAVVDRDLLKREMEKK